MTHTHRQHIRLFVSAIAIFSISHLDAMKRTMPSDEMSVEEMHDDQSNASLTQCDKFIADCLRIQKFLSSNCTEKSTWENYLVFCKIKFASIDLIQFNSENEKKYYDTLLHNARTNIKFTLQNWFSINCPMMSAYNH